MKILMVMNVPFTRFHGGANRSNRSLLEELANWGHQVAVLTPALASPSSITYETWRSILEEKQIKVDSEKNCDRFTINQVEIVAARDPRQIRSEFFNFAETFAPDWVLIASEDPSQALLSAALEVCPDRVVYLALTPQLFPFGPESLYPGQERTELIRRCALVCCLSHIIADYIQTHAQIQAHVYHPPHFGAEPFSQFHNFHTGSMLLMNASDVKGISIFLELARSMPHVSFATLPGYATTSETLEALRSLPNMEIWSNQEQLDDIFCRTRVLLMPTLWVESFGMAVVDAMLRGIPVLASDHGALPEACLGIDCLVPVAPITRYEDEWGENLLPIPIVPPQPIDLWRDQLSRLLNDESLYCEQAERSRQAALQFVRGLSVESFEQLLLNYRPTAKPQLVPQPNANRELTPQQKALLILRLQQKNKKQATEPTKPSLQSVSRDIPQPLSFAQQRLFFLYQLYKDSAIYNCPAALRLQGSLDLNALSRSFNELLHRHEALRTRFALYHDVGNDERHAHAYKNEPVQIIAPKAVLDLPVIAFDSVPAAAREQQLNDLIQTEASKPFDLEVDLLIRAQVIRLDQDDHVLFLNLHHIITDGWSTSILLQDLIKLYTGFTTGQPSNLKALPFQYVDYAVWQRQNSGNLQAGISYWKNVLQAAPAVLEFPHDFARTSVRRAQGVSVPFQVPLSLTAQLEELARRQDATLFMLLFAGFNLLLHRLSQQSDIVIGTPVASRNLPGTEEMVGFFVNTLLLRTKLAGNPTFLELLSQVRVNVLDALTHQDVPFEKLVEELEPERLQSYTPIFQVMFALQNLPPAPLQLPGLAVSPLPIHSGTAKFDLNMEVTKTPEGLVGTLEYDTGLFEPETIASLLQCWQTLLTAITQQPQQRLGDFSLLDTATATAQLAALNPPFHPLDSNVTLIELFRKQVALTPDAVAIHFEGRELTYAELEQQSTRLAQGLIACGVRLDQTVGICLQRSEVIAIAILGVLKAGGAYVPLDPSYPDRRLDFMISEAASQSVLTESQFAQRFADRGISVILLDRENSFDSPEQPPVKPRIPLDALAYVMYTSGSTGRPKGVQLSHRAVVNLILWHRQKFPAPARTLQFASLSFDASFHELFATFTTGGTLYILSEANKRDLRILPAFLRQHQIEKMILPVVVLHHLAEQCLAEGVAGLALWDVIATGERLKVTPAVTAFFQALPQASLHNDYGPTETHVITSSRLDEQPQHWATFPSIGRPLPNCRVYVLDQFLNLMPNGFPGELYLAGENLARGYHDRPELTAERFLPDPFSPQPGGRMYRTGDLAKVRRDSMLEYLGRIDHQIKLRGLRIEPGEIEEALRQMPGLRDCLVLCREDVPGDKRLVAYLVVGDVPSTTAALRHHLLQTLPDYMIPAAFVTLDRFPLTPVGKIDQVALPPPQERMQHHGVEQGPRSDLERQLCQIWTEVLDTPVIGIQDNFFALGGHSILMLQIASRIQASLGVKISIQNFFENPTIEQQATEVTELLAIQSDPDELSNLLETIEQLDETEVSRLLEDLENPVETSVTPNSLNTESIL